MKILPSYFAYLAVVALALSSCSNEATAPTNSLPISSPKGASIASLGDRFAVDINGAEHAVSIVEDEDTTWIATFTTNARTVTMPGPQRWFTENGITVSHNTYVRVLDAPFTGIIDTSWILSRYAQNVNGTKDILAIAMDYTDGGQLNAKYGKDAQTEGADFNDYLGVAQIYTPHYSESLGRLVNSWTRIASAAALGAVDCSGYMRLVWGHNGGIPMCFNVDPANPLGRMPRRSFQIWEVGVGTQVMTDYVWNAGNAPEKRQAIRIGDLVFFNAYTSTAAELNRVDHVGMYIGNDGAGNMRFIHSRKSDNVGPTFTKDLNGKSILNDDGTGNYLFYVRSLVGAKRL